MNDNNSQEILKKRDSETKTESQALCFLYNYNRELSKKPILLHSRVLEWYNGQGINCLAIQNQEYLTAGDLRNDTLKAVMRRDNLSESDAIEKTIFQHKLPLELIQTILSFGTQILGENHCITVIAPVQIEIDDNFSHYYSAEITGKLSADHIKIWHTFLRDVVIKKYMLTLFTNKLSYAEISEDSDLSPQTQVETLMKRLSLEERIARREYDNCETFCPAPESEPWEVTDITACIKIKKGNITFTLFKQ